MLVDLFLGWLALGGLAMLAAAVDTSVHREDTMRPMRWREVGLGQKVQWGPADDGVATVVVKSDPFLGSVEVGGFAMIAAGLVVLDYRFDGGLTTELIYVELDTEAPPAPTDA
jgi:hypothetical protein